jgi:hypothetical protein
MVLIVLITTSWLVSGLSPVHGDMAEQPMLDPVPLRGAGWEVADRDGQMSTARAG